MSQPHIPPGELIIEYPMRGETYPAEGEKPQYGVYAYSEYEESSVLAGQPKRSFVDSFDSLAEAQETYPTATWDGEGGSGYTPPVIPQTPPAWFDSANAGEHWHEDDAY
jgi:hypothetical protein